MITYAERACFSRVHIKVLRRAEDLVAHVPGYWGNELRCHELARALQLVLDESPLKLVVVDGKCGPIEHTWLRFADGAILDVYAPGRIPAVQLIDPIAGTEYREGTPRDDIRQTIIDRLVLEMRDE